MKVYKYIVVLIFSMVLQNISAQDNTLGLLSFNDLSLGGYTLLYPERQSTIFLIDECGEIVKTWEDQLDARPGAVAYLLENGNILRSKYLSGDPNSNFISGGAGGIIEIVNWENEVLWSYEISDSVRIQHHDIHFTPQGTVMIIVWERKNLEELLMNGFDTLSNSQRFLISDAILEVDPQTDSIIWEWHAWDHLIQDHDSTKLNYGNIANHPERININYQQYTFAKTDWTHCNSIDYNAVTNQVMISVKHFNEIWILDHSTTSTEALGNSGGNSNRGGNLLYRWGNPQAYQQGDETNRQLFSQHDAQWIDENDVNPDYEHFGKIALFNNFIEVGKSLGQILAPVYETTTFSYEQANGTFLPESFSEEFSHPDSIKNYSTAASSIQILGDGQVVMCAGRQGRTFELTPDGLLAWEYVVPLRLGNPMPQGFELATSDNFTFQAQRYLKNYPAFVGKTLEPMGFIELNPNEAFCSLVSTTEITQTKERIFVFPNPVNELLFLENEKEKTEAIEIFSPAGNIVWKGEIGAGKTDLNIQNWANGLYFIKNKTGSFLKKIVVQH